MTPIAIADLFCGAGGTSTGAVEALEILGFKPTLTAINHWDIAIATHTANHPGARHLCTSVDNINPTTLFKEGELEILWASPECTHHSMARGGKPINDQSRATAWCVVRWAEALRPNIILVENVPEFESWGAIGTNGRPLKGKKGATFIAWVTALESLGYTVDWRVLCAADYGDPTTRRRLFIQAVRGRRKNVWPDPTHAASDSPDMFSQRKAWVPARDIIDWKLQGKSIYDRKRPLSPKTMARIMAGLKKFGGAAFIVPQQSNPTPKSVNDPLPTVCAEGSMSKLVDPFLITMEHQGSVRDIDRPMPTITTAKGGAIGVAEPFLVKLYGTGTTASVEDPLSAVSCGGGKGGGHHALAEPFLIHSAHGKERPAHSVDKPTPTIAGNRGDLALVDPFIISAGGPKCDARSVTKPMGTVLTRDHRALVEPHLLPQSAGGVLRPVSEPAPTVATDGAIALVDPYLVKFYGTGITKSVDQPLDSVTTKERFGLARPIVTIDGQRYLLDIRFRMLQPHELAGAQGFRSDYKFTGNKTEIVKQIGNAVPRNLARALVLAVKSQRSDISELLKKENAA